MLLQKDLGHLVYVVANVTSVSPPKKHIAFQPITMTTIEAMETTAKKGRHADRCPRKGKEE